MYHPHYFHDRYAIADRALSHAAWAVVARLLPLTLVVHEPDDPPPEEVGRRGRAAFWLEERIRRLAWAGARNVVFHTDWERRRFAARFPAGRRRTDRQVTSGSYRPHLDASPADARRQLRLPADRVLILCIGFLSPGSPDKGYDRAIAAVREAALEQVELHIVGSPIRPGPEVDRYVEDLRRMCAETPSVHLHERYVTDEEFDLWVRAADAVLTPYREASSSAVAARVHALGTTLVTSGTGGLAEQLQPGDIGFDTDDELAEAIRQIAARR
jgi:glycosyltransferase involved in cell wall biosynthesis